MAYQVKELFLTLQGEGAQAGRLSVFCRFAGCNLWSGREADRGRGKGGCSAWCDTDFVGTDGAGGGRFADANALADAARALWVHPEEVATPFIVCTGGEPLLQLDDDLVRAFQDRGFEVAIETNGTLPVPKGVDWVCVSPKLGGELVVQSGQELKLVMPQEGMDAADYEEMNFEHFFLQPLDSPLVPSAVERAIKFCHANPRWRLSLQTHKLVGIP